MPASFVTPLVVVNLTTDARENARLDAPLVYHAANGRRLTVPAGFHTDLASIPQIAQAVIGKWERHAPAAVLHDWLYCTHQTTRVEADRLFAEAMAALGVAAWKRRVMWLAVRVGGGRGWRADHGRISSLLSKGETMTDTTPQAPADRLAACLAETMKWEGGWVNDPVDPGGPTMKGVTQRVYDGHRDGAGKSRRSVRMIEDYELQAIYRGSYWRVVRGDDLPPGVDLAVFDYAVNSGPQRAIKALQRAVNVATDGHLGAATIGAVTRMPADVVVRSILQQRRSFLRRLKTFWRFGKGWMRRCDGVEHTALAMAGLPSQVLAEDLPAPVVEADEATPAPGKAIAPPITSMAESTTGNAAAVGGIGSVVVVTGELQAAVVKASETGEWSWTTFAVTLLTSATFIAAAGALVTSAYIWLERRRKLVEEGA